MSRTITDAEILGGIGFGDDEFTYVDDDWEDIDRLSENIPYPPPLKTQIDYRDPKPVSITRTREPANGSIRYADDEPPVRSMPRFTKKEPMTVKGEPDYGTTIMGYRLPIDSQVMWLCLFFVVILICLQMYNLHKIHKIVKTFVKHIPRSKLN